MSLLYKYLPSVRESFLSDGLLRFTQPSELNDPFELIPAVSRAVIEKALSHRREALRTPPPHRSGASRGERRKSEREHQKQARKKLQELQSAEQFRQDFLERARLKANANIGVFSLSRKWSSSLMWSHYASAHTGFCVGFDRNHAFFQQALGRKDKSTIFAPVQYSTKRPLVEFRPLEKPDARRIALTKSIDWAYEEEERLIAFLAHADKTIVTLPFPVALFRVPSEAIAEIIVGLRASPNLKVLATKLCTSLRIPLYEVVISETDYDFERIGLTPFPRTHSYFLGLVSHERYALVDS